MRRGHRAAHPGVVLVCGALAAGLYCHGWSARAGRPSPQPIAAPEPPAGASWEAAIRTPAGVAEVRYFGAAPEPYLWATLPAGLDAAEPGLILEIGDAPPRVLGSIAPGRPVVPVPGGLGVGGGLGAGTEDVAATGGGPGDLAAANDDMGRLAATGDHPERPAAANDDAECPAAALADPERPAATGGRGRLVLADLARNRRLGWVDLPPGKPR